MLDIAMPKSTLLVSVQMTIIDITEKDTTHAAQRAYCI